MPRKSCPLCRAPTDPAYAPFCGRGCRDRDLIAWFGEEYRSPARAEPDHDDAPPLPPPARRQPGNDGD